MEGIKMTVSEVIKIVEENGWGEMFEKIGVRVQDVPFELGATYHISRVWVDGNETDWELDGICTIDLDEPQAQGILDGKTYFGDHMALLGGCRYTWGEDLGEIILEDAEVLYIFN